MALVHADINHVNSLLSQPNSTGYWIVRVPFHLVSIRQFIPFFSPLSFILDFATTLFVLTTEHTEMRRHDLVTGILLLLSIIDFALTAPVLVQECQACIDVVHIPKDVVTVLGRRGGDELGNVVLDYFKMLEEPVESSDAHAPSGSAPPGIDHEPANNVKQAPGTDPASSTANPGLSMEPSRPSSTASSVKGLLGDGSSDGRWSLSNEGDGELHDVPLDEYIFGHGLKSANWHVLHKDTKPSTEDSEKFDWGFLKGPTSPKEFGQAPENQAGHDAQQLNPEPADSYLNWDYWKNHEVIPPTNPRLTTKLDSNPNLMIAYQQPTGLTTKLDSNPNLMAAHLPTEAENVVVNPPPSPGAGSPTDSEHEAVTSPSLDTGSPTDPESQSQPVDLLPVDYSQKGKEKVSDTWEVGGTSQSKLPPTGRSLEPRE